MARHETLKHIKHDFTIIRAALFARGLMGPSGKLAPELTGETAKQLLNNLKENRPDLYQTVLKYNPQVNDLLDIKS